MCTYVMLTLWPTTAVVCHLSALAGGCVQLLCLAQPSDGCVRYVHLKQPPFANMTLLGNRETDCVMNGGFSYIQVRRAPGSIAMRPARGANEK